MNICSDVLTLYVSMSANCQLHPSSIFQESALSFLFPVCPEKAQIPGHGGEGAGCPRPPGGHGLEEPLTDLSRGTIRSNVCMFSESLQPPCRGELAWPSTVSSGMSPSVTGTVTRAQPPPSSGEAQLGLFATRLLHSRGATPPAARVRPIHTAAAAIL